jgi:hypothetical protein
MQENGLPPNAYSYGLALTCLMLQNYTETGEREKHTYRHTKIKIVLPYLRNIFAITINGNAHNKISNHLKIRGGFLNFWDWCCHLYSSCSSVIQRCKKLHPAWLMC